MKKKHILAALLLSGISLLAGIYFPQLKESIINIQKMHQDVGLLVQTPENNIETDELSIRLFKDAVEQGTEGANIFIAPHLTYCIMAELAHITNGNMQEQFIKHLSTKNEGITPLTSPMVAVLSACDLTLPLPNSNVCTLRLPFKTNKPIAQSHFNTAIAQGLGIINMQILTSENSSEYTRFVIGAACRMNPQWQIPFAMNNTVRSDFYNANGAIRRVDMMRCRGMIRTAKAKNESWEAVALFFLPSKEGNTPIAFIAILPAQNICNMTETFSADMFDEIRTSLARAKPIDCQVDIPRIIYETPIINNNKQMEELGFGNLFDAQKANFSPVSSQKIALDNIFSKISLALVENEQQRSITNNDARHRIRFDKPFIWLIGDLTSNHPPFYMGILQNI